MRGSATTSRSPDGRAASNPWPQYSFIYRVSSAHEEGGERVYPVNTECFLGTANGRVRALRVHEVELADGKFRKIESTDRELPADYVFLAMGFTGPEHAAWLERGVGRGVRCARQRGARCELHELSAGRVRRRSSPGNCPPEQE